MQAPLPDTYWVATRLLAGAYPGAADEALARARLARFKDVGVTFFLDLTEPGEYGLIPYEALLETGVRTLRKPVRDLTHPSDEQMREILDLVDAEIERGSVVYVHCYGGIGRTGTVVGCWLVRHGASGEEALSRIAELRGAARPSPETEAQKELILRWAGVERPPKTRPHPDRLERLPEQYFSMLLGRVAAAAATEGEPVLDLGRGNPEVGPPPHVVEALARAAREPGARMHGYPPFRGTPELREAVAHRYATIYGVELDPDREIAVVPGTKTAIVELALVTAERGSTIGLPDPGYPDYHSGVALAGARVAPVILDPEADWDTDFSELPRNDIAAVYLNFPSNPVAICEPAGTFHYAIRFAAETGAYIVHDFAYGDIVFEGWRPASFLAWEGAKEVGVEMFSMSKPYGMAGWRLGFVVGNEEIVRRIDLLQDHLHAGVFRPIQEAGIAALTGPQDSVAERVAAYQRRRDRVLEALPVETVCEGTFYVWIELPEGVTTERVLAEHRVALAPGEGFGSRGAGWARLSLAVTDETLEHGLERLRTAFA